MPRWSPLNKLRPHKLPFRRHVSRAAVALIVRGQRPHDGELFFIQRALREDDPWSGHMAFPGGRLQADDLSSRHTAMRETREETGLDLFQYGQHQRRLSDLLTRHHSRLAPMVITPHVFAWQGSEVVNFNHEVQEGVWVPLRHLADPTQQVSRRWQTPLGTLNVPCCYYQDYCIWGLSYSMLQEYLRRP